MGGKRRPPARATGPRCRGGHQVFACPIDRRLRLCVRVGTQHIFSSSCVVVRAWCLVPGARRRCFWRRCYASACGVRGVQGGVLACGAALWLRLLLRRRVYYNSHDDGCAWRGGCARSGCVARALGATEGWGWLPVGAACGTFCRRVGGVRAGPLFLCSRCR